MTAVLWHFTLVILQDFTSPDPLEKWNAEEFDRERSFGRTYYSEIYEELPLFSTDEFLALEEKAVQFYRRHHESPFEFKSYRDVFPDAVKESYEHLCQHQVHVANAVGATRAEVGLATEALKVLSAKVDSLKADLEARLDETRTSLSRQIENDRRSNIAFLRDLQAGAVQVEHAVARSASACRTSDIVENNVQEAPTNIDDRSSTQAFTTDATPEPASTTDTVPEPTSVHEPSTGSNTTVPSNGPESWPTDRAKMQSLARCKYTYTTSILLFVLISN